VQLPNIPNEGESVRPTKEQLDEEQVLAAATAAEYEAVADYSP
jgi:hypothetical protein